MFIIFMRKYLEYKDSGVEWIGGIPSEWRTIKLKYVMQNSDGKRVPLSSEQRSEIQGDYPYYGSNGIVDRINDYLFEGEYVLLGEDGAPFFEAYKDVAFLVKGKFWVNNHAHILKAFQGHDQRFLTYALNRVDYRRHITGSTRDKLTQDDMSSIELPIVKHTEQRTIANYLDRKTAQIDALIVKKERMMEFLKEERTVVINQAVTKGLDPKVEMKDSGIEWLGKVPKHWGVKRLKYLLLNKKGALKTGPFGSQLKQSDMQGSDVKVYNQRSVIDNDFDSNELYISNEKFLELNEFEIFPEDILLTTRGTIGRCAIFPKNKDKGILHPCLIRMQLNQSIISNEFVRFYIQDTQAFFESVKYNSNATTIDVIYGETLRDVVFVAPDRNEQNQIVNFLNRKTAQIDEQVAREQKSIELLKEYRTALISEAVTGKIDVRN